MTSNTSGLSRIQGGEQSKFDNTIGDLITIRRLCDHATATSIEGGAQSMELWKKCLQALERELWPYLDDKERGQLEIVRVKHIPQIKGKSNPVNIIRNKLDDYHKELLSLRGKKGLGLQASEDASTAVLQ